MNREKVLAGIERASQLMNSPEFNRLVESKAPYSNNRNGNVPSTQGGKGASIANDLAAFNAQGVAGISSGSKTLNEGRELPDFNAIKESMRKQPTPQMDPMASIMPQQQPQVIREVIQQTPQQPSYPQGIDYNYIKYIVNECIKENMATQLNENANLSGIKMTGGNKIQFTDRKGNIFEGTLKLIKKGEG